MSPSAPGESRSDKRDILRILSSLMVLIFITQLVVFLILQLYHPHQAYLHSLLDALIATILVSPMLYLLSIRPLQANILRRQQAEKALLIANQVLEERIAQRTADLVQVNQALTAEIAERQQVDTQLCVQTMAMEVAANGIIITGADGIIQWCNPAFCQMTGYSVEEVIGQSTRMLKSGEHPADFYAAIWNTILSGKVWHGELVNRRKDRSMYVEEQTITPVLDQNGKIAHLIAIKQDVSERRRAESRLEQNNRDLLELSREERIQRQFAEGLAQAVLALNTSLDYEMVLELILEQINRVIPYTAAAVLLQEGDLFRLVRQRQLGDLPIVRQARDAGLPAKAFPPIATIILEHKVVLISHTTQEGAAPTVPGFEWIRSMILVPLISESELVGIIALLSDQIDAFSQGTVGLLDAFAAHAVLAIKNARLFAEVRADRERLQALSRRLVEVQESERRYVACELHDEAGQALTSLLVSLKLLENNVNQPQVVLAEICEIKHTLEGVMEELHRLAMDLLPASLDHVGLVAGLRQYAMSTSEKHAIQVQFESLGVSERLSPKVEIALYRIVQEAVANVLLHANATQIGILLERRGERIILIVEDDGRGFDPDSSLESGRLGLIGMRTRAEMLGGNLVIESSSSGGTSIYVEVPDVDTNITGR